MDLSPTGAEPLLSPEGGILLAPGANPGNERPPVIQCAPPGPPVQPPSVVENMQASRDLVYDGGRSRNEALIRSERSKPVQGLPFRTMERGV
jgi:hypothetical protein